MKKFCTGFILFTFLISFSPSSVFALDKDAQKKIEDAGKKAKDLIDKYNKAKTTKYNEINVSVKDTDGNPRDCEFRIYYNDYKQEKFTTSGGSFSGMFDHGKTVPSKTLSVAVQDCPCRIIKMDQEGPLYPAIYEEIEKVKIVLEGEIEGAITDKLTEEGKALVEKGLTKFFEGMGYAGSAMAKRFMGAVSFGADMGAPIKDFINKEIDKIFDAVREEARKSHEITGDDTPVRNNVNVIKPRWKIRNFMGLTKPTPFTQYNFDVLLQCPKNAKPPKRIYWKPTKWIKPITPPVTTPPKPPVETGERQETDEEYAERIRKWNEKIERERKEREEAEARRAEERAAEEAKRKAEAEAKAKAEAEAQAKAERIAKECKKCEKIKQALDAKRGEYDAAWDALGDQDKALRGLRDKTAGLKRAQAQAEAKLSNFNEPGTDYVESDGRRIDATDIELRNAAAELGWERYQAGEIGAQELSDYWKSLDGDAVEALREKVKADLEAAAKTAKEALEAHEKAIKAQETKRQEAVDDLNKKKKEMEDLERAYKDCLKKCQEDKKINVLKDYGVKVKPNITPFGKIWPWNWGEPVQYSLLEFQIPEKVTALPDYSDVSYEELVSVNPTHEESGEGGENALHEERSSGVNNFHSVLNEINTKPLLVNQHQLGKTSQLVNVSTQPEEKKGTGGFGAALQILVGGESKQQVKEQGGSRYDETFSADYTALSDLPEVTKVSPGRDSKGVTPGTNFVLTFSEPMDRDTVEDNFLIRSFNEETLTTDDEGDTFNEEDGFGGDVWDDSHFDVDWNSDDTEMTLTFDEERAIEPPKKKRIIIIIIIDRRARDTGLVNTPGDFFPLPGGALDGLVPDPIFADGFESGDMSAWTNGQSSPPSSADEVLIGSEPSETDFGVLLGGGGSGDETKGIESDEIDIASGASDPIFTDGFESGDTNSWSTGESNPSVEDTPPVSPKCDYPGESTFAGGCTNCMNHQKCEPSRVDRGTQCYACADACSFGQHASNGCNNQCGSNERCAPVNRDNTCFECITIPTDIVSEPEEPKTEITTGRDPIITDPVEEESISCPSGSFERSGCTSCDAGCEAVPHLNDTVLKCYKCKGGTGSSSEGDDEILIPANTGETREEAPTENTTGSTPPVVSVEPPSCSDLCGQHGLSADQVDFTTEVESQLNRVSCVSSYSIQIQQATVGDCQCYSPSAPTVTFDTTKPVCTGTVCGDVVCGQSTSCATGENETTTVSCNWKGWKKEAQYQYRPLLGGQ